MRLNTAGNLMQHILSGDVLTKSAVGDLSLPPILVIVGGLSILAATGLLGWAVVRTKFDQTGGLHE